MFYSFFMELKSKDNSEDFSSFLDMAYGLNGIFFQRTHSLIENLFNGITLDSKKMLCMGSGFDVMAIYLAIKHPVLITSVNNESNMTALAEKYLNLMHNLKGSLFL